MNRMKYKFVSKPEHLSIEENQLCNKENCKNVHLWLNKRSGGNDTYSFAFYPIKGWRYAAWCRSPKEICLEEIGIIKEITSKLEESNNDSIEVSYDLMIDIFGKFEYKNNWQLFTF